MGEMKHTPGPWIVRPDYEDDGHVDELRGFDIVSTNGEEVVSCQGIIPGPRSREDAHLIAAAPDLRIVAQEALDTITDYLAYEHDGDPYLEDARLMGEMDINSFATDGRLERLRAALSKAEGRSLSSASGQEGGANG